MIFSSKIYLINFFLFQECEAFRNTDPFRKCRISTIQDSITRFGANAIDSFRKIALPLNLLVSIFQAICINTLVSV